MFEHALLDSGQQAPERRRALALALVGQVSAVATLVVVSMFYADKIVPVHLVHLVAPPLLAAVTPPEVKPQQTATSAQTSIAAPTAPSIYRIPTQPTRYVADAGAPELTPPVSISGGGNVSTLVDPNMTTTGTTALPQGPPGEPNPSPAKQVVKAPLRLSEGVAAALLVHRVMPVYPALAKQMRLSGEVRLTGIIGRDGHIQQLQVISGHPLLVGSALEAVKQWVYRPTMLNGEPVEVIAPIQVHFILN